MNIEQKNTAQKAATILVERRTQGIQGERLPEVCRPTNLDEALAIQNAVTEIWCTQQDDTIGGWKCGLPSAEKIVVAPIYTRTINSIPPIALWPKGELARIEPEFAFFFAQDLPARDEPYTPKDVDAAIGRTHMALELIGCRYSEPSTCTFPEMLADGLVNQGLFIGPEINSEAARKATEFVITSTINGEQKTYQGKHPGGNPRAPLYWLVEFLRSEGEDIIAGQAIITGSFAGVLEVPLNTEIILSYAGLGEMQVSFSAKTS